MKSKLSLNSLVLLLTNASWLLGTEFAAKITRLVVVFTLAASLDAVEYGSVMLAVACHEVFRLILRSGAGAQIIQCSEAQIKAFAQNGAILQWIIGIGLTIFQCAAALLLGDFYQNEDLPLLLSSMAGVYLLYPIVSVKVLLLHRANKLKYYSVRNAACITAENIAIALFAWFDHGMMSVVYGKWVFVTLWLLLFFNSPVKNYGIGFSISILKTLSRTSLQLFATELCRALRTQADILIGGKLLSPELFGIYSFAKTAGVNLGQALSTAFNTALYPFLCDRNRQQGANGHIRAIYCVSAAIACMFAVQAMAVSFYVPLLFKQTWQQEYLTISLLCLANVPLVFVDTYCSTIRSHGLYKKEFHVCLLSLAVFVSGLLLVSPQHFETFASTILMVNILFLGVLTTPHLRQLILHRVVLHRS